MDSPQILERINQPVNGNAIARGILHSRRLTFHNDSTVTSIDTIGTYLNDYLSWISKILPSDKYDRFVELMHYPLPTNELLGSIYKNLARVFEAEDATFNLRFDDKNLLADFNNYFNHKKFQTRAFRAMQTSIDSIVVCDSPDIQTDDLSNPYYYIVDISQVFDIEIITNEITLLIYKNGENAIAMDPEYIRKYEKRGDDYVLIIEIKNKLGRVPARMLWDDLLMSNNNINRKSPITAILGKLDKLLFDYVSRDYAELYGKYPILVSYTIAKKFNTGPDDAKNDGKGKHFLGAGAIIENPAPQSKEETDLNLNAVRFVNADPAILKFIDERLSADAVDIFESVVGTGGEFVNDQAKNEKQIKAGFESKMDVINNLKKNFQSIHSWVVNTICEMRYGAGVYKGCEIDYGNEFYLVSPNEILNAIGGTQFNDLPELIIMDMTHRFFSATYRTDKEKQLRYEIMRDLDPFPAMKINDVFTLYSANPNIIGEEKMIIKTHFEEFIQRFERENIPITQFGNQLVYRVKIETIYKQFQTYAKENNAGQPPAIV